MEGLHVYINVTIECYCDMFCVISYGTHFSLKVVLDIIIIILRLYYTVEVYAATFICGIQ